ncbi:MAG: TldD/PmbA family protein [Candidatus Aenigmatarchaeota archaeon]
MTQTIDEKLEETTKKAVEEIRKRGLKGDVYTAKGRSVSHSIEKGEIKDSSEYEEAGLGIRVIKDGKIGFGYCTPGNVEKGVKRAVDLSSFSKKLDIELPSKDEKIDVEVYDDEIEEAMGSSGIELTQEMIEGCSSVKDDISPTRGGLNISVGTKIVGNTEGVLLKDKGSMISGSVTATLSKEETSLQAHEIGAARRFDLDFTDIGGKAGRKVDLMREASDKITGEYPVMISSYALTQLIGFGLIPALIGENVRKGKSVYEGKMGEKVASSNLIFKDDPTVDWGIGSGGFDDEGVKSKTTRLISDGVLQNFLYDLKEGMESDRESTGNGIRSSFKTPPATQARNIVLRGEDKNVEDLLPDKGIYVDDVLGAHTANPVSGDFSVVTNPVWQVENGEKKGRIDGLMISGNLPEVLNDIVLGEDYKRCFMAIGSHEVIMDTPSARIEKMTLSSK